MTLTQERPEITPTPNSHPRKFGVVGSGIVGLFAARTLLNRGHEVTVFEIGDSIDPDLTVDAVRRPFDVWKWEHPGRDEVISRLPINRYRIKAVGGTTLHWGGATPRLEGYQFMEWLDAKYYDIAETALGVFEHAPSWFEKEHFIPALDALGLSHRPARNTKDPRICRAFSTCFPYCPAGARFNPLSIAAEIPIKLQPVWDFEAALRDFDVLIVCAGTVESTRLALINGLSGGSHLSAHMAAMTSFKMPIHCGGFRLGYPTVGAVAQTHTVAVSPKWGRTPPEFLRAGELLDDFGKASMLSSLCEWHTDDMGEIEIWAKEDSEGWPIPAVLLNEGRATMGNVETAWTIQEGIIRKMGGQPTKQYHGVSTDHLAGSMSVDTNRYGQHWQDSRVYFFGNSVLPNTGFANPTLTALAYMFQAVDHEF